MDRIVNNGISNKPPVHADVITTLEKGSSMSTTSKQEVNMDTLVDKGNLGLILYSIRQSVS